VPDGMKCDAEGNVWVTAPGGVWVYDACRAASRQGFDTRTPGQPALGREDWRTLFVCASTSVYAVDVKIGPRIEPFMRSRVQLRGRGRIRQPAHRCGRRCSFKLDTSRCALIIQDMQNDVVMEGGAFADSGSPQHCREQNAIENARRLAQHVAARSVSRSSMSGSR
jgi:gluconolactonase